MNLARLAIRPVFLAAEVVSPSDEKTVENKREIYGLRCTPADLYRGTALQSRRKR